MAVQAATAVKEEKRAKKGQPVVLPRNSEKDSWKRLFRYGQQRAKEMGIGPEDVMPLIEEYRAEVASSKK